MTRSLGRRFIALAAAYALALQVFLPVAFSAVASAEFPTCSSLHGAAQPASPDRGGKAIPDCCGALCSAPAIVAVPPVLAPVTATAFAAAVPGLEAFVIVRPGRDGPRSPRPPPAA